MPFPLFFPLYNLIAMHDVPLYMDSVSKLFVLLGTVYSLVYFFIFILEHWLYETSLTYAVCFSWQPILISVLFSLYILHAYRHTYICTFWYNTFASILPLLKSIMQCFNIWESKILCSFYFHLLSVLFIWIMAPLLSTLLSETFQACVPYFILIFLIHSSTIISKYHISLYIYSLSPSIFATTDYVLFYSTDSLTLSLFICLSVSVCTSLLHSILCPYFCVQQIPWQFSLV